MIKTLFDIDYLAQYEPYHISRKRGKVREMEYKRKVDKKRIPTCNIMGVNIAAINMEWLVDYLEKNISEIKGDYICVSNVHTTVTSFEDADYCAIQNGGLMAIPDGGPLSTVGQKRGHKNMERTTGPSLMGEIFEISAKKGYRHYFYGSKEETLELLYQKLTSNYPGIQIAGMYSPPFRPLTEEEDRAIVERINETKPDFVWVGLGAPKQEKWMAVHQGKIDGLMLGVGAGFDYYAENIKRAPMWMQKHNLEWVYRLVQDPKRLFKRYWSTNTKFIWNAMIVFDSCNTVDNLAKFQGSKYVQSQPGLIFRQVKETLLTGREVLFIGVPCQVDGLKKYLNKEYSNLLVVDIICHGVPSPKLWRDYCTYLEEVNGAKAVNISYRYKKPNWTRFSLKVDFDNNKSYVGSKFDDPYLISFLKEISMRENCYSCEYTSTNRTGDITLADFWGYHSYDFKMRNTEKGISLVMINTEKGQKAFENIKSEIAFQERTIKEAIGGNRSLKEPWKKNPTSEDFWREYIQGKGMNNAFEEYCKPYRFPAKMRVSWFITNHMFLIPKPILEMRKKFRGGG